ncbi:MAG TPA: hypothetical protein VFE78_37440 [Gemmataceae bacterium]|nr:hypothetical protein [Gemmataceae bacterium]
MDEGDYWAGLEYRVCRELAGMKDWGLRHLWCDGFIPEQYRRSGPEPRITGRAWVCYGARQDEWKFTLFLPCLVGSREEIDWVSLLPPENVTRWLALDQADQHIQIEPSAAVPDLA